MKKILFLLSAVIITSVAIYSCQDHAFSPTDVTNPKPNAVSDRNFYDTCEDCFVECNDCCLTFHRNSGAVTFVYKDAMTGNLKTFPMTSVTVQDTVVCALSGYLAVHAQGGSGTVTSCSENSPVTRTGVIDYGTLNLDCTISL